MAKVFHIKKYFCFDLIYRYDPSFPFIMKSHLIENGEIEIFIKNKNDLLLNINHEDLWIRRACRRLLKEK